MFQYMEKDDRYFLVDIETGEVLDEMDEVAIAFEKGPEMWTLLKHGKRSLVEAWLNGTHTKYMQHGLKDIALDLRMISGKFPVDELNHCLDTSDYIKKMVEKLGLEV
jgi:hypothetical protein